VVNNDWLDVDVLEDYLDGKLDAKMMNRVERLSLEDPFVAQALAGLSESPRRSLSSLSLLQKQLEIRIAGQQESKKRSVITWQRLSIAAAAAVIFVAVSIMFWMRQNNAMRVSSKTPAAVEVNLDPTHHMDAFKPNGGWAAFFVYVNKNNRLTQTGKVGKAVELSFQVNEQGKPTEISIIRSPGKPYADESIRLLQAGPTWKIPAEPAERMRISIDF
jgi:TonB family protein